MSCATEQTSSWTGHGPGVGAAGTVACGASGDLEPAVLSGVGVGASVGRAVSAGLSGDSMPG